MDGVFHILNRGVDKRKIFLDNQDRLRFVHDLFEFNDQEPVNTTFHIFQKVKNSKNNVIGTRNIGTDERKPRSLLVNIHAFCIMSNHYHLLLSPQIENGAPRFMQKLNIGYVRYFNERYKRNGTLFEGGYKFIPVIDDSHFIHLPYYIHLNPLDAVFPEWRDRKLRSYNKAIKFLNSYRWSSHLDYIGHKNFPSVTQRDFLIRFFGDANEYKDGVKQWLRDLDLDDIRDVSLE